MRKHRDDAGVRGRAMERVDGQSVGERVDHAAGRGNLILLLVRSPCWSVPPLRLIVSIDWYATLDTAIAATSATAKEAKDNR